MNASTVILNYASEIYRTSPVKCICKWYCHINSYWVFLTASQHFSKQLWLNILTFNLSYVLKAAEYSRWSKLSCTSLTPYLFIVHITEKKWIYLYYYQKHFLTVFCGNLVWIFLYQTKEFSLSILRKFSVHFLYQAKKFKIFHEECLWNCAFFYQIPLWQHPLQNSLRTDPITIQAPTSPAPMTATTLRPTATMTMTARRIPQIHRVVRAVTTPRGVRPPWSWKTAAAGGAAHKPNMQMGRSGDNWERGWTETQSWLRSPTMASAPMKSWVRFKNELLPRCVEISCPD